MKIGYSRGEPIAVSRRPRGALGFVGPHPARGVSHSEGRQRRRITIASQRPAGVDGALAGRTSRHRSVPERHSSTSQHKALPLVPRSSDPFNAMPGMLSRWSLSSLSSDGVRQRRKTTSVGPAEPRQRKSVLSRPCQRPAASPPRPVLVSLRTVMVGSSMFAKEPHTERWRFRSPLCEGAVSDRLQALLASAGDHGTPQ